MFSKIKKEIDEFTSTIKGVKACDEMLIYANSSFIACIKLLMFASSTFSIYGRVLIFFLIFSAGLLLFSIIGAVSLSIDYMIFMSIVLFIVTLVYIIFHRKILFISIENSRKIKENS